MGWRRLFWQKWLWLRFRLGQQRRYDRLVLEWVAGRPFLILPQVFNPTLFLTSEFMVQALDEKIIPPGSRVLDMGTGSGIGAVFVAQWADQVVAVDVNPAAVRCARINVLLNELDACVQVKQSDLFAALSGERFDVILFNPPYFAGQATTLLEQAFYGTGVIERFAAEVGEHLTRNGRILLLLSSLVDEAHILSQFADFQATTAAQKDVGSEILTLYQLVRRADATA
jgi:release factor glutamine methyltransferase